MDICGCNVLQVLYANIVIQYYFILQQVISDVQKKSYYFKKYFYIEDAASFYDLKEKKTRLQKKKTRHSECALVNTSIVLLSTYAF